MDVRKIDGQVQEYFKGLNVEVKDYNSFYDTVGTLDGDMHISNANCVLAFVAMNTGHQVEYGQSHVAEMKAIKN